MSKPGRTNSLAFFLSLSLVGGYITVELLYFAHSVSMAAGLPIGLGLVWLCSDVLASSESKKPPGRAPDGFFRDCQQQTPVPLHSSIRLKRFR